MPTLCGGTGEVREPDENVKEICEKVREEVQAKSGKQFQEFTPVSFRSQLVNGTNYFIKVRGGGDEHLHLRVHKSFQGDLTLSSYQLSKTAEDELVYFQ
uniref:Cell cycle-regulated histone H1-binding protein n=1 Tax=Cyriopagopus schmidti TaxID=29017 RepID=B5M6E3_CYRSC|nr:cell cycle-regulated histone H1-binding protein [Cyriopagopus schmidti]